MDKYAFLQDLWDYLYLAHPLRAADVIIGFGSHDQTIATRAARLHKEGWAPLILFTGYLGKGTEGFFPQPEAELYARIAIAEGVDPGAILIEGEATNTGENIRFSRRLLESRGLSPRRIIAVHKPYMTRRVWAALRQQWPEVEVIVAPGDPSLSGYLAGQLADGVAEKEIIDSLVGDFQRMDLYAKRGWQIAQEAPPAAQAAYQALLALGYDRYVV
ncbi:MAG: YdcF family protein [Christensenellales bacterium]